MKLLNVYLFVVFCFFFPQKEINAITYPTNCEYSTSAKIDCVPPFQFYTGYDTDFHKDDCNVTTITPTGTLAHYRKTIQYTTNVNTPAGSNTGMIEDPLGSTINFNLNTYISYISFWWKGVGINGTSMPLSSANTATRASLFTIGNNTNVVGGSFTVYMFKGLPCILGPTTTNGAGGNCPGSTYYSVDYPVENIWKKFDITWVKGTYCYRIYMNGAPIFSYPNNIGYTGTDPYYYCTNNGNNASPQPYNNPAGINIPQKMYYPIQPNTGAQPTNAWQLLDLYIYTDTMNFINGYPNSNYNQTYMDMLVAKSYHCGPRYGFGYGCKPNTTLSQYKVSPVYQYQTMSSLDVTTSQELNGVKRYILYADSPFMNDNLHTDGYNALINYINGNSNTEMELVFSFKTRRMMIDTYPTLGTPLLVFRSPTNRKLISLFSYADQIYACLSLYSSSSDTISLVASDNNCIITGAVSPFSTKQTYVRVTFSNSILYTNNTGNFMNGNWAIGYSSIYSIPVSSMNVSSFDKSRVSKNGLYVSELVKDLYWYQPITADIATRNASKYINPSVYDDKLNSYANLVNSSYANYDFLYPLGGKFIYNTTTLSGYLTGPAQCLGNCAVYTSLSPSAMFVSLGNTTTQPVKTCTTGFANIGVGCQTPCTSGDTRIDGLCLTGTTCYCPYGFLQSDGITCECGNKWTQYGLGCNQCTCDNVTSICNSGLKGNGQCICNNPFTMRNYSYFNTLSLVTMNACECVDSVNNYGMYCNNTCTPKLAPANCSSGVYGNGSLSCSVDKKQIEILADGVAYCQCKNPTKQYGFNCTDCKCDYPSTCKGSITGDGSCTCPTYTTRINATNGRTQCECSQPSTYGPFCSACNCTLGASCNSGINGTGVCFCSQPGYTLNSQGNGCDCPSNYYGTILGSSVPNDPQIGLCNPCPACPYGATCSQGRSGNGTCVTLPGYKCLSDCGISTAAIECIDINSYGMNCAGICPECKPGSKCNSGMNGDGYCSALPAFTCVENCASRTPTFQCTNPEVYGANCTGSCRQSRCRFGTYCSNGYLGNGSCIVMPFFKFISGTLAEPVYDCADENRYGISCTGICPLCPYGSICSNGTTGTGLCVAQPNFEEQGTSGTYNCIQNRYGLACENTCTFCPAGSYCPSGITSTGGCLPLPYFRQINDNMFDCNQDRYGPGCFQVCPICTDPNSLCDSGTMGTGTCKCIAPTILGPNGICDCPPGTSGPTCQLTCPSCDTYSTCNSGLSGTNQCNCNGNLTRANSAAHCDCPPGFYGNNCSHACQLCPSTSICNQGINGTGECRCPSNQHLVGSVCECDSGYWGDQCQNICPNCNLYDSKMYCSDGKNGTGICFCTGMDHLVLYQSSIFSAPKCQCAQGWRGDYCLTPSPLECAPIYKYYYNPNNTYYCDCFEGFYNTSCNSMCPPCNMIDSNSACQHGLRGSGSCNCKEGFIPGGSGRCVCPSGKYGKECLQTCKSCTDPSGFGTCNDGEFGDGSCICPSNSMTAHFNVSGSFLGCQCDKGFYGINCDSICYENCPTKDINSICNDGMAGDGQCKCSGNTYLVSLVAAIATCECQPGFYGTFCNNTCRANYTMYDPNAYCVDGTRGNGSVACRQPYVIDSYFPVKCECPKNTSGINCDIQDQVCSDQNAVVNSGMHGDGKCYCNANTVTQSNNGTSSVKCICPSKKFGNQCLGTCPPCASYHPDMYCLEGLQGTGICICNSTKLLTLNYTSTSLVGTPSCQCQSGYGGNPCTLLPPPPPCPLNQRVVLHSNGSFYCDCEKGRYGPTCDSVCPPQTIQKSVCLDGKNGTGLYVCQPNTFIDYMYDQNAHMVPFCRCSINWSGDNCDRFCNVTECQSDNYRYCNTNNGKCECQFPLVPYKGYCECIDKISGVEVFGSACDYCYDHYWDYGYPNPHVKCDSGSLGSGLITCSDPNRFDLVRNTTTGFFHCLCKQDDYWGPECLPCPICNGTDSRATCNKMNGFCQCPSTHYLRYNSINGSIYCECPHGFQGDQCDIKIVTSVEPCPYPNQLRLVNLTDSSFYCACRDGFTGDTCEYRIPVDPCLTNQIRVVNLTDGSSFCQCKHNYMGATCEMLILPEPCGFNQIRVVNMTTGDSYCKCVDGFTGIGCTEHVLLPSCGQNFIRVYNETTGISNCICMQGWQGENCTERITVPYCGENQIRIVTDFTLGTTDCVCVEGWVGPNCTIRATIPPCRENELRLVNLTNGYTYCSCIYGYQGPTCSERVPIQSCGENGLLVVNTTSGNSSCQCIYGRSGDGCQTTILPESCPFPNQIRVVDPLDITKSICICRELFDGPTCSRFVDQVYCPPNAYTILDPNIQFFSCACKPFYSGPNCETYKPVFPCPISRQILILNVTSGDTECQCSPQYTGPECSLFRNQIECNLNQMIVVNEITFQPECRCKNGWTGVDCMEKVLPPLCPTNYTLAANYSTGELFCRCRSDFNGDNCDIYIPSVSCSGDNSITLMNHITGELSCGCKSLWSGVNCTVPSVYTLCPVNANAVINPVNSSITCQCMPGFTGPTCDENIVTPAPSIPICGDYQFLHYDNITLTFSCSCMYGLIGDTCQPPITCNELQVLIYNQTSKQFECGCIGMGSGIYCNETISIVQTNNITIPANTTIAAAVSDAFGLSSLSTTGQIVAVTGYTAGVGIVAGGAYYMVSQYLASTALKNGVFQVLAAKDSDEVKEEKKIRRRLNKDQLSKVRNEKNFKKYEERLPLIKQNHGMDIG